MKNYLFLDTETTILNKGHPYDPRNKLCFIGCKSGGIYADFPVEYGPDPYGSSIRGTQDRINTADLLVCFNAKFDCAWLRRYGISIRCPVYCCQLAEFVLSNQTTVFPSLDGAAALYGLERKLDVVSTEYWAHGIDTPLIPRPVLQEYLRRDVDLTEQVFYKQQALWNNDPLKKRLFYLQCKDLLILQEMEQNGLLCDLERSKELAHETETKLDLVDKQLAELVGTSSINWASPDQCSAVLYGGAIAVRYRETYTRTLKDGRTQEKERWATKQVSYPALVRPVPGSENAATSDYSEQDLIRTNESRAIAGQLPLTRSYSVSEPILRQVKARGRAKQIVELLLYRAKLDTLNSTYYKKFPEIQGTFNWSDCLIHGEYNQVVAITGRLSASRPNLQNVANEPDVKGLFKSRFV